jgi:hypothetical protein
MPNLVSLVNRHSGGLRLGFKYSPEQRVGGAKVACDVAYIRVPSLIAGADRS